jgi:hypothetical protein
MCDEGDVNIRIPGGDAARFGDSLHFKMIEGDVSAIAAGIAFTRSGVPERVWFIVLLYRARRGVRFCGLTRLSIDCTLERAEPAVLTYVEDALNAGRALDPGPQ